MYFHLSRIYLSTNYIFRNKSNYLPCSYPQRLERQKINKILYDKYVFSSLFSSFPPLHLQHTSELVWGPSVRKKLWREVRFESWRKWWWRLAMTWAVIGGGATGGAGGGRWLDLWWSLRRKNKRRDNHESKGLSKKLVTNMFICWQLEMITLTIISVTNSEMKNTSLCHVSYFINGDEWKLTAEYICHIFYTFRD